jgi:basic membrane lipoprotein Med (substrate-binding protein (PBP1-ABC) superfamily)
MDFGRISRRHLLQGSAALTLGTAFGARPALAADTTIGFIYVGSRDDYGYNQAHAQGAAALKKMPGLKIIEEEKVPETDAVEKTMESMINLDGATLLFPTSFGYYNPHMIKMASKFPRTPAVTSATSTRRNTSPASSPAIRPRATSWASSRRNRSRKCCATSMPSPWAPSSPIRKPPRR